MQGREQRRPTARMADVARMAGVSVTTVSHVLNRTREVAEPTRARVDAAIASVGYVPNHVARSLVRSRSQLVGLVLCDIATHQFYLGELFTSIESALGDDSYTVLLASSHESARDQRDVVDALLARQVDGIIMAPTANGTPTLDLLHDRGVPTVLVDRIDDERFDRVGTENVTSLRSLTRHLAETRHRRIGMLSGIPGINTTTERLVGYRAGLADAGLPEDPALIATGGSMMLDSEDVVIGLLEQPDPPTALVVGNNAMALGTMRALRRTGRRVPEDIAVVTFDDFVWAEAFTPRLTTVAQDGQAIGERAAAMLVDRLRGEQGPPQVERVPTTIMHRDSCGCRQPDLTL